ncbi:MAG: AMP-binding protein, partial [Jatrophihabitantaceae bacterium]
MTRTEQPVSTLPGWLRLAATVLGRPQRQLADEAATSSFLDLGGSSLRALELVATAERDLASTLELSALLTEQPLRLALGAVRPVRLPTSAAAPVPGSTRPASPSQVAMIVGEQLYGGSAFHLLFTADVAAALEEDRLRTSVAGLLAGHEGLRTVVEPGPNGLSARVIAQPRVPLQVLAVPPATAVVPEVQRLLAAASRDVLRPTEQPAIQFYLTPAGPRRTLVSLLVHHALVDGWSIALLWRELFDRYAGAPVPTCQPTLAGSTQDDLLVAARIRELTGVPTAELPSDLTRPPTFDRRGHRLAIELTASDTAAVTRLARRLGCSRNAALLGLWGLVLLRRTDEDRMIIGVSAANRNHANLAAIGLHTNLVPMVVDRSGCTGVGPFLRTVSAALGRALDAQTVPFEGLVAELRAGGQSNRNPVAQFGFAAHDELIPDRMHCGDVDVELTEGHCGGTVFEALLFVQRWPGDAGDGRGRLVLEYATSVVTPALAGALAEDVRQLIDVCAAADDVALACLPGQPATGLAGTVEGSLWSAIESATRVHAERSALRAGQDGRPMSYRQLLVAAEAQSQLLHDVGVRAGDTVFLCAPQRAEEIVAVLAVIRLGARYVGLDPQYPAAVLTDLAARCRPAALLVADDVTLMAPLAVPPVVLVDPWQPAAGPVTVPSCPGGPDQVVSVAFTSGSTGSPKGVLVPAAGVLRLARRPRFMAPDALQRFLRLAPLSFDAATLEIFAPLLSGGTIEILPRAMPSIAELDEFIGARRLTGAWLTAGLFRLAADHRPGMFAGLRQLLTGGDVIPVDQVRQVLR